MARPTAVSRMNEAQVAYASLQVAVPGLTLDRALGTRALLASMQPGTRVIRYHREWFMAKHERKGNFVYGRIGYQAPGTTEEIGTKRQRTSVRPH